MIRKTLAAFAAAAATFAVGLPAASADTMIQGVSVNKTPEQVVFTVNAPDAGEQLALFVDPDGDHLSDVALLVGSDLSVEALKTPDSTEDYLQIGGPSTTPVTLPGVQAAQRDGVVTVTVPTAELNAAFNVAGAFDVTGRSFTDDDKNLDGDVGGGVIYLSVFMDASNSTHVGAVYAPQAPTHLTGVAGNGKVTVSWDAPADADEYALYMNGEDFPVAFTDQPTATVEGLTNGTSYSFTARAGNSAGVSGHSLPTSVTPLAPVVIPPVAPQPPATPQPPVNTTDTDADGINNDWLVNGKPVAAPAKPKLGKATGKSVTIKLPKAPKGSKLVVYVGTGNGKFSKAGGKLNKKGELTVKGLKKNTTYEVKVVKVNKAGKQSAASKPLKVKTKKH